MQKWLLAIAALALVCVGAQAQNYVNSQGLLFNRATGALMATSTPVLPIHLNSAGLTIDANGYLVISCSDCGGGAGTLTSVNGFTGPDVILAASDVGAVAASGTPTADQIASFVDSAHVQATACSFVSGGMSCPNFSGTPGDPDQGIEFPPNITQTVPAAGNARLINISGEINQRTDGGIAWRPLATTTGFQTLTNKILTNPILSCVVVNTITTFIPPATAGNCIITNSNTSTINLTHHRPDATGFGAGSAYYYRNLGTGAAVITPSTPATIDGLTSVTLYKDDGIMLVPEGSLAGSNIASLRIMNQVFDDHANLSIKPSATLVAIANLTLSGNQSVDGVTGTNNQTIVLATAQTAGAENGPWVMQSGAWTRPAWWPAAGKIQAIPFNTIFVRLGTAYGGSTWRMTTTAAVTIDTTATVWGQTAMALSATSVSGILPTANLGSGSATSSTYLRGDQTWATIAAGGDASTNTSSSVDGEAVLFSGTGGKTLKRSALTGILRGASGVSSGAELSGVVLTSGSNATTPGKADVMQSSFFCADAGANDSYACNLSPAITAYVAGAHYWIKANTANTGTCSVNLNSVGAITIKKVAGGITTDLADNDIRAGQYLDLVYDGTNMEMQSLLGNAPAGGGTVTSVTFTGDGTVLSSTPSSAVTGSGTVAGTLATAAAHTALANLTGSTAAPTYGKITSAEVDSTIPPAASPTFSGVATFANGTASAPSVVVRGTGYGMSSPSSSVLNLSVTTSSNTIEMTAAGGTVGRFTVNNASSPAVFTIRSTPVDSNLVLGGGATGASGPNSVIFSNVANMTSTTNNQNHTESRGSFVVASGSAAFGGLIVDPTINQTSTASGTIRVLGAYPINTGLLGTEYLLGLGTSSATGPTGSLTDKFTVDNSGNVVQSGNHSFSGAGNHINTQAATTDISGTIALSSATSATKTFTTNYSNAPTCVLTPTSDPTATGVWWVTTTTSTVVAHVATSGTITFNYHCIAATN